MIKHSRLLIACGLLAAAPALAQVPVPPAPPRLPDGGHRPVPPTPPVPPAATRGYLGVMLGDNDRTADGGSDINGATITDVTEDSPADRAGLLAGDVVLEFAGTTIDNARQLSRLVGETRTGVPVAIEVLRNGERRQMQVTLGRSAIAPPRPPVFAFDNLDSLNGHLRIMSEHLDSLGRFLGDSLRRLEMRRFDFESPLGDRFILSSGSRLGADLQPLTAQLAKYFGVASQKGVLIGSVDDSGAARSAGLMAGDVVIAVDGKEVRSPRDVTSAIASKGGEEVELRIVRDRREQSVRVTMPKGDGLGTWFDGHGPDLFSDSTTVQYFTTLGNRARMFGDSIRARFFDGDGSFRFFSDSAGTSFFDDGDSFRYFADSASVRFFDGDDSHFFVDSTNLRFFNDGESFELRRNGNEVEIFRNGEPIFGEETRRMIEGMSDPARFHEFLDGDVMSRLEELRERQRELEIGNGSSDDNVRPDEADDEFGNLP